THWAIEQNAEAANTFKSNFPDAEVQAVDANEVLRRAIDVNARPNSALLAGVPAVGKVDMIYCGPPCQAVSRLNIMPQVDDSKNTLFAVAMSFVELYRPKVFFLENVTGILDFQLGGIQTGRHVVEGGHPGGLFRFMIRVLLSLGYQVTWTVAQVGGFGCPQSRRR
ncbi:S-adenosyl-L-methionine-dependent methyltransferase, partial [Catenaria anguillulae PL171]